MDAAVLIVYQYIALDKTKHPEMKEGSDHARAFAIWTMLDAFMMACNPNYGRMLSRLNSHLIDPGELWDKIKDKEYRKDAEIIARAAAGNRKEYEKQQQSQNRRTDGKEGKIFS